MYSHEKLIVYQRAVEFLGSVVKLLSGLPAGNADVVSQLRRAAMSISLNIAECHGVLGEIAARLGPLTVRR